MIPIYGLVMFALICSVFVELLVDFTGKDELLGDIIAELVVHVLFADTVIDALVFMLGSFIVIDILPCVVDMLHIFVDDVEVFRISVVALGLKAVIEWLLIVLDEMLEYASDIMIDVLGNAVVFEK